MQHEEQNMLTTVKNILEKMLSAKYRVVATPLSYNTPLGICKAAEKINAETEIFIAETNINANRRKTGCDKEINHSLISPLR